ncbi:AAA domain-containing protein [Alicyclobacillus acidocaldarius]|uniref:Superfamily I DNA and RNA helicase and helicase subunits-like protein n=1 Tax=Alicyclobacillus acidocaldarius subsp. acidocaldarius (strain ATCC 27009 / DSM 446 / BCRC 14685 / JCM 5260 / KCTC 1825 / NBRC 15652 / NCIMB 11725 / NRRL B-14509 / 104-IA) TaxID=521098 RepID=C8WWU3_ALIAD|nr:AAA domain-containing protein [Alicyclobacillus acidocaldarius]ACV58565.1 Superfamily I DNA and RNA helicase and helicase subunits-like protein [Alicyclobacillus acidocaldarius subsp. acidocaldarius DSM 446]
MRELLQRYRDRLIDLTPRNISLRLLRISQKNHCDIASFSLLSTGEETRIASEILALKSEVRLCSALAESDEHIVLNRRLTYLKREMDLIEQEMGINTFHVAYGFLEGTLIEDFYIRSPVLLYPARLVKKTVRNQPNWIIQLDEENPPFWNPTLLLALRRFLGVNLIEHVRSETIEVPKTEVLDFVLSTLKQFGLNVTSDSSSIVKRFPDLRRSDIPQGRVALSLQPYMVMGKFRQSSSTLLSDYDALLEKPPEDGLLFRLLEGKPDEEQLAEIKPEILNEVNEEETYFVLNTDVSQEAAVIASRERDGLIVHGPPGTGKSQVIVNLIVDRLARGQRVLVVCQKPVALDVVYNRLASLGLHQHVVRVHDAQRDRALVYATLAQILQQAEVPGTTSLVRVSREMQELAKCLDKIAESLHKPRPFGRTLRFLYAHAIWDQNLLIDVADLAHSVTYDDLQSRIVDLKTICDLMQKYDHPSYPWAKRKSFAQMTNREHMRLQQLMSVILQAVERGSQLRQSFQFEYTPEFYLRNRNSLEALQQAVQKLENRNLYKHVHLYYSDEEREFEHEDQISRVKQLYNDLKRRLDTLRELPSPIEGMTESQAQNWAQKIDQFLELQKKMRRFLNSTWYSLRKELREHCSSQKVLFEGSSVRRYRAALEAFLEYQRLRRDASRIGFTSDVPIANDIDAWERWLRAKQHAIEFLELYVEAQSVFGEWLRDLVSKEDLEQLVEQPFLSKLDATIQIADITKELQDALGELRNYLQSDVVDELLKEVNGGIYDLPKYELLSRTVSDFDSLVRLDQLKEQLDSINKKLIERCQAKVPIDSIPNVVEHWCKLIKNSFYHFWIENIEREEPHVYDVSTDMYARNRSRYIDLLQEKRKYVPQFVASKLVQASLGIHHGKRTKLKHEASKKRKLRPLRQVISEFFEEVLTLVPCWLCTPDAVTAIFPPINGMFDLVIFDEASQCPVENAIPSIFRGKQIVVAGDEKQLPPTNLFKVVDDDVDEVDDETTEYVDKIDIEAKHLLEWAKPRLPEKWLRWHYRSAHDALINFSNYAFYGNRIQTAPAAHSAEGKPIEFIRVDGQWANNQNRVEAEKIVDIVIGILRNDETAPTLGIITFNKAQADLIEDVFDERAQRDPEVQNLIERARQRKNGDEHVGLFVKNIENVQGDERDIILFSVAYAKDERGVMSSQFGSLSQEQGENRLNVAITRARKKVYIVCSFEPSEWTRAENYSRGPRLLKKYLEYAKAVSDGDDERVSQVLNSLVDATAVNDYDTESRYDSPFEEEVATELRKLGYTVNTQVGFSGYRIDLAIVDPDNPERYLLAVECDGATYHSSKVARERDFYRQRFLEQHGWNVHRVWSRNWLKAKHKEIEKIQSRIRQLKEQHHVVELSTFRSSRMTGSQ